MTTLVIPIKVDVNISLRVAYHCNSLQGKINSEIRAVFTLHG